MRHLRLLTCRGCGLDDEDLEHIARCSSTIESIDLSSNPDVTDNGLRKLSNRFDRPHFLVDRTAVTNGCLREVAGTFGFNDDEVADIVRARTDAEFNGQEHVDIGPKEQVRLPWGFWPKSRSTLPEGTILIAFGPNGNRPAYMPFIEFAVDGLEQKNIWLHLNANTISSETTKQINQFGNKLQLLAIDADDDHSVEEVLALLGELPHLETLFIGRATSTGDLAGLQQFPNLRELAIFDTSEVYDSDLRDLKFLQKLQVLRIPDALVTASGITKLQNEIGREFSLLQLPTTFLEIQSKLVESGITAEVDLTMGGGQEITKVWREQDWSKIESQMDLMFNMAEFPRAKGEPMRPEDYILNNYALLASRRASELTRKRKFDSAVELLSGFLQKYSSLTNVPIDDVVDVHQKAPDEVMPNFWAISFEVRLWKTLARANEKLGKPKTAFEYLARSWLQSQHKREFAEWRDFHRNAARVAKLIPDSPETRRLKQTLFLTPTEPLTRYERAPERLTIQNEWCPVLAPAGYKVEAIETHFETEERAKRQIQQFLGEQNFAMISKRSFPCTIKISPLKEK